MVGKKSFTYLDLRLKHFVPQDQEEMDYQIVSFQQKKSRKKEEVFHETVHIYM